MKNLSMPGISLLRKLVKETLAGKDPAVLEVLAETHQPCVKHDGKSCV